MRQIDSSSSILFSRLLWLFEVFCISIQIVKLCTPMFITTLFTIARTWKQPRCPSAEEWIRKLWYIYTMGYYSAVKEEHIWVRSNEVDETGAYYTEWSKSERETPIPHISAYILEFGKTVTIILYARQQKRHRCKEQTFGLCERRQGWDGMRE